jgi:two-component system LytT family response regulator
MEQARVTEFTYTNGRVAMEYKLDDIVAFESSQKYTEVVLRKNERRPILDISLVELEKRYGDLFVRSHRGVLVRRDSVVSMSRTLNGMYDVHLNNGHVSPISRREKPVIRSIVKSNEANRALAELTAKEVADATQSN